MSLERELAECRKALAAVGQTLESLQYNETTESTAVFAIQREAAEPAPAEAETVAVDQPEAMEDGESLSCEACIHLQDEINKSNLQHEEREAELLGELGILQVQQCLKLGKGVGCLMSIYEGDVHVCIMSQA